MHGSVVIASMASTQIVEEERVSIVRVLLLAAFLAPISIDVGDDTVSANYLFGLLLLFPLRSYRGDALAFVAVCFAIVSWVIGAILFSSGNGEFLLRQAISAALWLAPVMLLFLRLPFSLRELCVAAVVCGVGYSLFVMWTIAHESLSIADVYVVKASLREMVTDWPQRYVIVLIFGFYVALERARTGMVWAIAAITIAACIFLTFTRAAWLGLFVALPAYWYAGRRTRVTTSARPLRETVTRVFAVVLIVAAVGWAATSESVVKAFETIYDNMSLVAGVLFSDGSLEAAGSEETRFEVWSGVLDIVARSPLTGTGFAGAHLLVPGTGSAHSQYFDALLRTGAVGLLLYLFFWAKALGFYVRANAGIFAALVALFVFGFLHETTKLSYGAFLFFFLLSKASELHERERQSLAHSLASPIPARADKT